MLAKSPGRQRQDCCPAQARSCCSCSGVWQASRSDSAHQRIPTPQDIHHPYQLPAKSRLTCKRGKLYSNTSTMRFSADRRKPPPAAPDPAAAPAAPPAAARLPAAPPTGIDWKPCCAAAARVRLDTSDSASMRDTCTRGGCSSGSCKIQRTLHECHGRQCSASASSSACVPWQTCGTANLYLLHCLAPNKLRLASTALHQQTATSPLPGMPQTGGGTRLCVWRHLCAVFKQLVGDAQQDHQLNQHRVGPVVMLQAHTHKVRAGAQQDTPASDGLKQ